MYREARDLRIYVIYFSIALFSGLLYGIRQASYLQTLKIWQKMRLVRKPAKARDILNENIGSGQHHFGFLQSTTRHIVPYGLIQFLPK